MQVNWAIWTLVALLSACNDSGFSTGGGAVQKPQIRDSQPSLSLEAEDSFTLKGETISNSKIDIVFVVDTSASMLEEKASLETNMATFINEFTSKNAGVDYHFYLIGEDFNFPSSNAQMTLVEKYVDSNNGLAILYNFIALGINGEKPRDGATVEAVVITDDNAISYGYLGVLHDFSEGGEGPKEADSLNASEFDDLLSQLGAKKPKVHINGLVGKVEGENSDSCNISEVGTEYETLASMPAYSGVMLDLCQEDWTQLLTGLAGSIIKKVEDQMMRLTNVPDLNRLYRFYLNDQLLDAQRIRLGEDGSVIILDENLLRQKGTLRISYYKAN